MVWFRSKPHRHVHKWPEVRSINDFAAFLGAVAMVIRGLGFLVVTWTTVVLLGGFVSVLQKKDFWSLTVITFIQIARVVNNYGNDKWRSVALSAAGLDAVTRVLNPWTTTTMSSSGNRNTHIGVVVLRITKLLGWIAWVVQLLTCMVVFLCSFFVILLLGPYIATGVSLWRLRQHDYGKADGDSSKENMNPALGVLYAIVVLQGAMFIYRAILGVIVAKKLVAEVAKAYGFQGPRITLVEDYMKETRTGCAKNPFFAKGMNLVIYAVDMLGPDKSPQDCLSGLRILSTILGPMKFVEQGLLARQLIFYTPSSHIFNRLLDLSNKTDVLYGTNKYEQREVRKHAANIVVYMAPAASPEQLPQVIQCLASLIGTFEEYQQMFYFNSTNSDDDGQYAKEMGCQTQVLQGLHGLFTIATDDSKCRLIIHTRGLLAKIMTPIVSDFYHHNSHETWRAVQLESLKVLHRLTAAYGHGEGETGAKLLSEIEANLRVEVVEAVMRILSCDQCSKLTETVAMGIVTNLHMQMQPASREDIIEKLADIYTSTTTNSTRIAALEALATLCFRDGSNATTILQVNGSAVYSLTGDLEALSDGYQRHHISVAEILQHACLHHTRDDECLRVLKESMTDVMPKMLNKILTEEAAQAGQQGGSSQTNGQSSSSSLQEDDIRKIETTLLSLCLTIHETFISADQNLALQFDDAVDAFSLPWKLSYMVERNSDPTASCLKRLKLTSKMVISMMKCRGSTYPKQDLLSLVRALQTACTTKMRFLDDSMDFASSDTTEKITKPERSLRSIVTEATDLARNYSELEVMASSGIVSEEASSN